MSVLIRVLIFLNVSFYSPSPIVYTEEKRGKVSHRIELKLGQRGPLLAGKVLIVLCSARWKTKNFTKTGSNYKVLLAMDLRILHNFLHHRLLLEESCKITSANCFY